MSRALNDLGLHVLALDSNQNQTSGAERWKAKEAARRHKQLKRGKGARSTTISQHCINGHPSTHFQLHMPSSPSTSIIDENQYSLLGSLTHQTIRINRYTLQSAIHDWLLSSEVNQTMIGELPPDGIQRNTPQVEPVPVMIVALHACGSLTPDVLRAFLSNRSKPSTHPHVWTAQALIVVGCCYNLMTPEGENRFLGLIPPHVRYSCTDRFSAVPAASSANSGGNTTSSLSPSCCANSISMAP